LHNKENCRIVRGKEKGSSLRPEAQRRARKEPTRTTAGTNAQSLTAWKTIPVSPSPPLGRVVLAQRSTNYNHTVKSKIDLYFSIPVSEIASLI
jgi:hypothetical protein